MVFFYFFEWKIYFDLETAISTSRETPDLELKLQRDRSKSQIRSLSYSLLNGCIWTVVRDLFLWKKGFRNLEVIFENNILIVFIFIGWISVLIFFVLIFFNAFILIIDMHII